MECVYCAVRPAYLNAMHINFICKMLNWKKVNQHVQEGVGGGRVGLKCTPTSAYQRQEI
jgi:hypothetical protein